MVRLVIVGASTWLGTLAAIFFAGGFNAVAQFYLFATVSLVGLVVDIVRLPNHSNH